MSMIRCRECSSLISDRAKTCPQCGAGQEGLASKINRAGGNAIVSLFKLALFILLFLALVKYLRL